MSDFIILGTSGAGGGLDRYEADYGEYTDNGGRRNRRWQA